MNTTKTTNYNNEETININENEDEIIMIAGDPEFEREPGTADPAMDDSLVPPTPERPSQPEPASTSRKAAMSLDTVVETPRTSARVRRQVQTRGAKAGAAGRG